MILPVFLLEDHKYVTESYISALRNISVEAEMVISYSLTDALKKLNNKNLKGLQLAIEYSIPPCEINNLRNGEDIAKIIRDMFPEAKIIIISAMFSNFELESVLKSINPEGIIEKSDMDFSELCLILQKVLNGEVFYSARVHKTLLENEAKFPFLDALNVKIIGLLSQGIATKNLPKYLPLSLSGVHKRKAKIKEALNIDTGSDEAIIKEARKKGFI